MLVFACIKHVLALRHLAPCVLHSFCYLRALEGEEGSFPFIDSFVWAVGWAETIVKNPSRWTGMNFAAAAQFAQTTRPYRIYCLAESVSAAANKDASAVSLDFAPCTGIWVKNKDVSLSSEAFNVSHRLVWIPGLLEMIFEESAILIS